MVFRRTHVPALLWDYKIAERGGLQALIADKWNRQI